MAAPTELTNYEKVIKCFEYNLKQISHDTGFYTEKFVVDETDDPAQFLTPTGPDWDRYHRFAQLHQANDEIRNLVGNHSQHEHTMLLLIVAEQTNADKAAGLTLKAIRSRIIWDIKRMIRQDNNLNGAAIALSIPATASGMRLSCINPHVAGVLGATDESDVIMNHPFIRFVVYIKFEDKENIQAGIQAG